MRIKKFTFSAGAYFGDNHSLEYKNRKFHYSDEMPPFRLMSLNDDEGFTVPKENWERFLKFMETECYDWKRKYLDQGITDGYCWSCNIRINDFVLKSEGYVAYPENYEKFLKELGILCGGRNFGTVSEEE